ncbi:MAG: polyribonucleotide nucleotidyltransferase, partial [Lachnospiraceae bacterium]|nr:polyribonucleotide nucleotidyltransferase [Lachnospiraceae bacterium]
IMAAHDLNRQIIAFIQTIVDECGKPKHSYESCVVPQDLYDDMVAFVTPDAMEEAVFTDDKQERDENIRKITAALEAHYSETNPDWVPLLGEAVYKFEKMTVRKMILKDHKRPDGRAINQIRPLAAEVDLLPRVHGSAMFTRGQTQILNACTLAPLSDAQRIEGLDVSITTKRYMHHYNFPAWSVGETKPSRGPGRREIGHGALAERALIPVLPSVEEFPYAIRTVSETLESNGSTSQASVCASTMSLMAAGVPIKAPVAGISVGLVTGESDDDYIVLTDIQGLEDFFGDMDFKVAGTKKGITAIQMDIKIHGLTPAIIREAFTRTREAREYILDEVILKAIPAPRPEISKYAPKIVQISIDPEKIGDVIGKQGKVINKIIEDTGVQIDIEDDGSVNVCGTDLAMIHKAIRIINTIVNDVEVGQVFQGRVVRLMQFGAFVELVPGKDGLVHISKLDKKRVAKVEDVVNVGDEVVVKVVEIDKLGRVNLSMKDVTDEDRASLQ